MLIQTHSNRILSNLFFFSFQFQFYHVCIAVNLANCVVCVNVTFVDRIRRHVLHKSSDQCSSSTACLIYLCATTKACHLFTAESVLFKTTTNRWWCLGRWNDLHQYGTLRIETEFQMRLREKLNWYNLYNSNYTHIYYNESRID